MMKKKSDFTKLSSEDFKNAPFKSLRGFTPQLAQAKTKPLRNHAKKNAHTEDEAELFLRSMEHVKRIDNTHDQTITSTELPVIKNPASNTLNDEQLFLQAVQQIGTRFCEKAPDTGSEETGHGSLTSRMRQLKRGTIRISQELDLHGFLKDEAIKRLEHFIVHAFSIGQKAVLIITGKGINSAEGPVLRGAVVNWLQGKGKGMIAEYCPAPRNRGGSGAFVIFLKKKDNL